MDKLKILWSIIGGVVKKFLLALIVYLKTLKKGVDKQRAKEVKQKDKVKEAYDEIDAKNSANRDSGVDGVINRLHELYSNDKKDSK